MPFWTRPQTQPIAPSRRQRKRMERSQRKAQRRWRRRLLRWGFAAGAFVVGLAVVVSLLITSLPRSQTPTSPSPTPEPTPPPGSTPTPTPILTPVSVATAHSEVRRPPEQGAAHIPVGTTAHPPYNTIPPTSGWHWPIADAWGIKTTPREDELLVHNLEHGGVIASYDPELLSPEQVKSLEDIFRRQKDFPCYLIVTPYRRPIVDQQTGLRYPLALTAWTAIQYLVSVDEAVIQRFIDQFRNRGPERVACTP